jgi:hypothetical protein
MSTKIFSDNVFEKIVLLMFIVTTLFLLTVSMVIGTLSIDSPVDIPPSVYENTDLSMSFTATTNDTENNIYYEIYQNNILVSNTSDVGEFSTFMNYSSAGIYIFKFVASDGVDIVSETHNVTVINVPMTLNLLSPISGTYNTQTISINIGVSTYANQCFYILNNSMSGNLVGSDQSFGGAVNIGQDGKYFLYVNCSNGFDVATTSVAFNIDTLNPVILSKSYNMNVYNVVTLNAVTDVNCNCKYDIIDRSYDLMSASFANTNSLQHSTTLSGFSDGTYTYYIKCKNYNNLVTNTETLSFSIINRPSASISLSKSPPIKAGTYDVRLTTNKPVVNAPSLYYNFDNDASPRYVTLTGAGTDWRGYLIIDENTPNIIGTFHYSATDQNGNTGTLIIGGEIFLVDTTKPIPPSSFTIDDLPDGKIKLRWYYDGETAHRYNIYRSTNGNPEYVDYFDSTESNQYIDNDVIDGITYYYRIAAVDAADNDGLLSQVLQATSNRRITTSITSDTTDNTITVQEILDSGLIPKVDQLVSEFNSYLTDMEASKKELNDINDPNKLKVINILKLTDNAKTAQATVNSLITQANNLKNQNLQSSELDVQLNRLRMEAIKAKSTVAEDIIISEQSSYDQVTQEADVNQAISELVTINLSRNVLNNYSLTNKQLQDGIVVNKDVLIFKIRYLGKDDYDKYTLVKKVVTSSQELKDVSIIEMIPKSFERLASDIIFDIDSQQKPVIVKDDPVLRWDVDTFNKQTVYYMINNNAEMSSAKDTKTIVLYRPDFKVTQTISDGEDVGNNILTGLISLDKIDMSKISLIQWFVFIGIGLILGLSVYYVALDGKEKKRVNQRLKDHKIISKSMNKTAQPLQQTQKVLITPSVSSSVVRVQSNQQSTRSTQLSSRNSNPSLSSLSFDIGAKLDQANDRINNFDYENARIIYNECMQRYSQIIFKKVSEKNDVKRMLNHLYTKLTAYRIIYLSRKHVNSRNYPLLKQDIVEITKICNKLYSALSNVDEDHKNDEQKFIDYVSNSKKHLESIAS